MRRVVVICCLLIVFSSCKSTKNLGDSNALKNISTKKIWKNNKGTFSDYKTISSKIKGKFKNKNTAAGFNLNLRMEIDQVIWMSVKKFGIPFAKLKITPEKVMFYEKLKRTYFEGDFSLITDFLGTPLDFNQLQNLLLGRPIVEVRTSQLDSNIFKGDYKLFFKKQQELFHLFFTIDGRTFTLKNQEIKEVSNAYTMVVNYPKYEHKIPQKIEIRVLAKNKKTMLDLEFKSVQFNKTLRFPFSIPKGYKKLSIKK
ncbi:MAG: DUF4292 domain-containing protein [Flavobacteriaceae bacterium]|nr:DUF4292 domain-containing protein [Flavobacteriaceae bacterium]